MACGSLTTVIRPMGSVAVTTGRSKKGLLQASSGFRHKVLKRASGPSGRVRGTGAGGRKHPRLRSADPADAAVSIPSGAIAAGCGKVSKSTPPLKRPPDVFLN